METNRPATYGLYPAEGVKAPIDRPDFTLKPKQKPFDFTTVLATASGSGMLLGSVLGLGGALLGAVVGASFGYWAQITASDNHPDSSVKGRTINLPDLDA